jgi:hypothetical protein
MSNTPAPAQDENGDPNKDSAWVTIETPFDLEGVTGFLNDVERLFRINSQLIFEDWQSLGDEKYRFTAKNLSNEKTTTTEFRASREADTLTVAYQGGLKTTTTFHLQSKPDGTAELIVTDDYSGTPLDERQSRVEEVDKSLTQWGRDLRFYLLTWKKWAWFPGWKWYMRRVWQPMRPMARRICYLLIMVTLLEFIAFLMIFTIFWLELDKYL